MVRKSDPSGRSWGTFLRNHAPHIAAMDLFVVPTIGFDLLYVLGSAKKSRGAGCASNKRATLSGRPLSHRWGLPGSLARDAFAHLFDLLQNLSEVVGFR